MPPFAEPSFSHDVSPRILAADLDWRMDVSILLTHATQPMDGISSRSFASMGNGDAIDVGSTVFFFCHCCDRVVFQISTSSGRNAKNSDTNVHPRGLCGSNFQVEMSNSGSKIGRIGPKKVLNPAHPHPERALMTN
mmetsp:Transcript_23076/g.36224  ORF Transcript_23076/g.36224 Transcript_23076/m.36224 type:complete len:136 (-) Transcript_23076:128-535(-)